MKTKLVYRVLLNLNQIVSDIRKVISYYFKLIDSISSDKFIASRNY